MKSKKRGSLYHDFQIMIVAAHFLPCYTHMRKDLPWPPLRPAVLLAGRSSTDERAYPPPSASLGRRLRKTARRAGGSNGYLQRSQVYESSAMDGILFQNSSNRSPLCLERALSEDSKVNMETNSFMVCACAESSSLAAADSSEVAEFVCTTLEIWSIATVI